MVTKKKKFASSTEIGDSDDIAQVEATTTKKKSASRTEIGDSDDILDDEAEKKLIKKLVEKPSLGQGKQKSAPTTKLLDSDEEEDLLELKARSRVLHQDIGMMASLPDVRLLVDALHACRDSDDEPGFNAAENQIRTTLKKPLPK